MSMNMIETPIAQTHGTLGGGTESFHEAIALFNRWATQNAKMKMPVSTDGKAAFDFNNHAQVEVIEAADLWASRFQTFSTPERMWKVETFLKREQDDVLFATRLSCLHEENKNPPRSLPGFVKKIVTEIGLFDEGLRLKYTPTELSRPAEVAALAAYIKDPKRTRPVFVATIPKKQVFPVVDVITLAKDVGPLGHCFVLPDLLTYTLTEQIGQSWAVFGGSLRTFFPGFHSGVSAFRAHPLAKPPIVKKMQEKPPFLSWVCALQAATSSVEEPSATLVPQYEAFCRTMPPSKTPQP